MYAVNLKLIAWNNWRNLGVIGYQIGRKKRDKSYKSRLKILSFFELCKRTLVGNFIEAFEFIKGNNKVDY